MKKSVLSPVLLSIALLPSAWGAAVFYDDFETGTMANWTATAPPNILDPSTTQNAVPAGGRFSALMNTSADRMHRNLIADNGGVEVDGEVIFNCWIYDPGATAPATRIFNEIRGYAAGTGLPNGGTAASGTLDQLLAIGKYNTVTLPGEVFAGTKYQARARFSTNGTIHWFNLNAAGSPNRSVGWHKFTIRRLCDRTTIEFYVDGTLSRTVTSAAPQSFDTLVLGPGLGTTTGDAWIDGMEVRTVCCTDTVPPVLACPANVVAGASSSAGAVVSYPVPVGNDACDGPVPANCNPPSGSTFPPGTTTVTCTATDSRGNPATCTFAVRVVVPVEPEIHFPGPALPPPTGVYISPADFHVLYANGIVIEDIRHRRFTQSQPPPPAGGSQQHTFDSTVEMLVRTPDGGTMDANANARATVLMSHVLDSAGRSFFDTEMLQLDISGGNLPPGVMVRESPTLRSTGQTSLRMDAAGANIGSFFDVFTELSMDGGANWVPAQQSARVGLRLDPTTIPPAPAPTDLLPPPNHLYVTPAQFHAAYAQGIIIRDIRHRFFTQSQPPPPPDGNQVHEFGSQVDMQVSMDGGQSWRHMRAPALTTVGMRHVSGGGGGGGGTIVCGPCTFDTEMLQLEIVGGDLPPGVMLRESPTRQSTGGTALRHLPDGTSLIHSFFDVFTELSVDGGQSWSPADSAAHVELTFNAPETPKPTPNLPPQDGEYVSPADWHAAYAAGIIIKDIKHNRFTQSIPPPPPRGSQTHQFGSQVEFQVSTDGGQTFSHGSAPANVVALVRSSVEHGQTRYFDTEMLQLNIQGGALPPGVMIRESPTRASLGRTSIRQASNGFQISSFFDVFTELTVDGGQSWGPSLTGPADVILNPGPCYHLECPADIAVFATSSAGAVVTYPAPVFTFTPPCTLPVTPYVYCTPPSGSTFPLGTTTVRCRAEVGAGAALAVCSFEVTVRRPIRVDHFPYTLAQIRLQLPTGGMEDITLAGEGLVETEIFPNGETGDLDGDGLDDAPTLMTQLMLHGFSRTHGPMVITLSEPASGMVEETANKKQGMLDVPPFGEGTVDSFFDVFVEIRAGGMVLHTATPVHMLGQLRNIPPATNDKFSDSSVHEILDANNQPTGTRLIRATHIPNPEKEIDNFEYSLAQIGLRYPNGQVEQITLAGPAQATVCIPPDGTAADTDGDGLDQVPTELTGLSLSGMSSQGPVLVTLDPTAASLGQIEENANNTPGTLDLPPFRPSGSAATYFDVQARIQVGANTFYPSVPLHIATVITHKPPRPGETYISQIVTPAALMAGPCIVPDNGSGTVNLPPAGCDYLSPQDVHMIIDGLPPGTTIQVGATHNRFFCPTGGVNGCSFSPPPGTVKCDEPGGNLGGERECSESTLQLNLTGTGMLAGWNRQISLPANFETHIGPRTPGQPVQTFDTDMFRLQGQITGDPDFDLLRITAGSGFGMPSPGHTTLTQVGGGNWNVDSFFDITYRIDFVGRPGGSLGGMSGSTTATIRMQTGQPAPPPCPVQLLTATGQPTGICLINESHTPNPPIEIDRFEQTVAEVTLCTPQGEIPVQLSGPSTVHVIIDESNGMAADTDGDGRDQVPTEMVQLDLTGIGPGGPVQVRLRDPLKHPFQRSRGQIEELSNTQPGRLDIPPFAPSGLALSEFDLYLEVIIQTPNGPMVLHNDRPKRMRAVIDHKPPGPGTIYEFPDRIELLDENENPTGISICKSRHIPVPPEPEIDHFPASVAQITLCRPDGTEVESLELDGPTTVHVFIGPQGQADDSDGDGLDDSRTEMVQMNLTGTSSMGPVTMRLRDISKHPFQSSGGSIEETANTQAGRLDLPPFAPSGTAVSEFEVYVEIEIQTPNGPMILHNDRPKRMRAIIDHKPPGPGTIYEFPETIPLLTENEQPSGLVICKSRHITGCKVTIRCPEDVVVCNDQGECGAKVNYPAPVVNATCPPVTVVCVPASGSFFNVGTTPVTCTARDSRGNQDTCTFRITVRDCEPPRVVCPNDIVVSNDPNACGAKVDYPPAAATDNCPGAALPVSCTPPSGSFFPVGTTTVICTATDAAGNVGRCEFTITVRDTELPRLVCPTDIRRDGCTETVVDYSVTVTDNCPNPTVTCTPPSGSPFPVGSTPVTCTATDASGNTASCTFKVEIICACAPPPAGMVNWWTFDEAAGPVANDIASFNNVGVHVNAPPVIVGKVKNALCFNGDNQYVQVRDHPEVNFRGSCVAGAAPAESFTIDAWIRADSIQGVATILDKRVNPADPIGYSLFLANGRLGFQMADGSGGGGVCGPTASCQNYGEPTPSITAGNWHFIAVTVQRCDATGGPGVGRLYVDGNLVLTFTPRTGDMNNPSDLFIGIRNPAFGAANFRGCIDELEYFKRALSQAELQSIYNAGSAGKCKPCLRCPDDITIRTCERGTNVCYQLPSQENCPGLTIRCEPPPCSFFPANTSTIVVCEAFDATGQPVERCQFAVTVIGDTEPPAITCPNDLSLTADPGLCGRWVNYPTPPASDNCPGVTVSCAPASGTFFPVGTTVVTCTATDGSGNTNACSFRITIRDQYPPIITCPQDITVRTCDPRTRVTYAPNASDNCPGVTVVCAPPSGSAFPPGSHPVTCTATDASGNTASCSFKVTVIPLPRPKLEITYLDNGQVRICWETECPCWRLQFTRSLNPPIMWQYVNAQVSTVGNRHCVTLPAKARHMFFRLYCHGQNDVYAESDNFPPQGTYLSPHDQATAFTCGDPDRPVLMRWFVVPIPESAPRRQPPCPTCPPDIHEFETEIAFQVSNDGGETWMDGSGIAQLTVSVGIVMPTDIDEYETEILRLEVQGQVGGRPVRIRESPTRPSLGRTIVDDDGDGYRIDSFFDVFTEVSMDGGQTWCPSDVGVPMTLHSSPPEQFSEKAAFPPPGMTYSGPGDEITAYENGVLAKWFAHLNPPDCPECPPPPCPECPPATYRFSGDACLQFSTDGGQTWNDASARVADTVVIESRSKGRFAGEIVQLDIAGGTLPQGVMIRESPTRQSMGGTTLRQVPGGYRIGSFFDIFTELSLDGGQTWSPSRKPSHVILYAQPPPVPEKTEMLPPEGSYMSPPQQVIRYANGVMARRFEHPITSPPNVQKPPPCETCPPETYELQSNFALEVSTDGGQTWQRVQAPAAGAARGRFTRAFCKSPGYDVELLRLDVSGQLPGLPPFRIRESSSRPSKGLTRVGTSPNLSHPYAVDSFFDVFTELSVDGGNTWHAASEAAHMVLKAEPPPSP